MKIDVIIQEKNGTINCFEDYDSAVYRGEEWVKEVRQAKAIISEHHDILSIHGCFTAYAGLDNEKKMYYTVERSDKY